MFRPLQSFTLSSVTKHWHRLPRVVVESPSLQELRTCVDLVLRDTVDLAVRFMVGLGDHKRLSQTKSLLDCLTESWIDS